METSENEKWRVGFANELIKLRNSELELTGFLSEEIDEMLNNICTN